MAISLNKILLSFLSRRLGRSATRLELLPRIKAYGDVLPELSALEKRSIMSVWDPISNKLDFDYWRFYKALMGECNPLLVPDNLYWSSIIRVLNPVSLTRTYINKSLYPIIFRGVPQPQILLNVINGTIYDCNMDRVSLEDAAKILTGYDDEIVVKPTVATSGGAGVKQVKPHLSFSEMKRILSEYGQNYICQKKVRQSKYTSIFNESSLNTFRVNTLNLNGKISCECLMMRHGTEGAIVDNFAMGGVACGMNNDGVFNGNNFNNEFKKRVYLQDGTPYSSHSIPGISTVIQLAIDSHQRFMPHIGHAAWDFAIDEDNNPLMIEVNLMLPGIILEQLSSGSSIFGDRIEEVILYVSRRAWKLPWTEYVGGWQ